MDALAVPVDAAARMVGVSRATLYPLLMTGQIPSFTIGTRRLVPLDGLREFVEAQVRAAAEAGQ